MKKHILFLLFVSSLGLATHPICAMEQEATGKTIGTLPPEIMLWGIFSLLTAHNLTIIARVNKDFYEKFKTYFWDQKIKNEYLIFIKLSDKYQDKFERYDSHYFIEALQTIGKLVRSGRNILLDCTLYHYHNISDYPPRCNTGTFDRDVIRGIELFLDQGYDECNESDELSTSEKEVLMSTSPLNMNITLVGCFKDCDLICFLPYKKDYTLCPSRIRRPQQAKYPIPKSGIKIIELTIRNQTDQESSEKSSWSYLPKNESTHFEKGLSKYPETISLVRLPTGLKFKFKSKKQNLLCASQVQKELKMPTTRPHQFIHNWCLFYNTIQTDEYMTVSQGHYLEKLKKLTIRKVDFFFEDKREMMNNVAHYPPLIIKQLMIKQFLRGITTLETLVIQGDLSSIEHEKIDNYFDSLSMLKPKNLKQVELPDTPSLPEECTASLENAGITVTFKKQ